MRIFLFIFVLSVYQSTAQEVEVVKYEALQEVLSSKRDKLVVVNFWATWCGPCLAELPHFMEVNREHKDDPAFEMLLVSLDPLKQMQRVKQTILRRKLNVQHFLLDDNARMNEWIPSFEEGWSGGIPATLLYKDGKKVFFAENTLSKTELKEIIANHKN